MITTKLIFANAPIRSIVLCAAAFGLFIISAVEPAVAADAFNGSRLAEHWCSACHVVSVGQHEANADAPPFGEIARRPGFSEVGLATFLLDPHAKMPNMTLSRFEAGDIAAYVATLR
jgi:mono/diheme cytochrome c family protein